MPDPQTIIHYESPTSGKKYSFNWDKAEDPKDTDFKSLSDYIKKMEDSGQDIPQLDIPESQVPPAEIPHSEVKSPERKLGGGYGFLADVGNRTLEGAKDFGNWINESTKTPAALGHAALDMGKSVVGSVKDIGQGLGKTANPQTSWEGVKQITHGGLSLVGANPDKTMQDFSEGNYGKGIGDLALPIGLMALGARGKFRGGKGSSLIEHPVTPEMGIGAENFPTPKPNEPFDLQSHISGPGLQGEVSPNTVTEGMSPGPMASDRMPTTWQSIRDRLRQQMPEVDSIPDPVNKDVPIIEPSRLRSYINLPKGLMSVDLPFITSAGFRQARPLVGTANWFKAWIPSVRSYGSQAVFDAHEASLNARPLFADKIYDVIRNGEPTKISLGEKIGLNLTDSSTFTKMEESIRSTLAERLPAIGKVVKASNRSYNAFLNDIRVNTAEDLINDAIKSGLTPDKDLMYFKAIGDFVNDATGKGKLDIRITPTLPKLLTNASGRTGRIATALSNKGLNLERSASVLNEAFFAPKLITSRLKFFNPNTYINAPKGLRKQYVYGLLRSVGTWGTVSSLGYLAGADVSLDPTSADFGKMKIGDLRIDPGAGFQQILVGASRLSLGESTSSTTDKTTELGSKFNGPTGLSVVGNFAYSKLSPVARFAVDILSVSQKQPVNLADRTVQMAIPLIVQDLMEVIQEDPSLLRLSPLILPAASAGVGGVQRYGKGVSDSKFMDPMGLPDVQMTGFPGNFRMGGGR